VPTGDELPRDGLRSTRNRLLLLPCCYGFLVVTYVTYYLDITYCIVAVEPCPAPYSVDYEVAKSLSLQPKLYGPEGQLIGDASDALDGSPKYGLEILANYRYTTLMLDLTECSQACGEWEVVKFRLTVLGVSTFIVTIGNESSDVIQVFITSHHIIWICYGASIRSL